MAILSRVLRVETYDLLASMHRRHLSTANILAPNDLKKILARSSARCYYAAPTFIPSDLLHATTFRSTRHRKKSCCPCQILLGTLGVDLNSPGAYLSDCCYQNYELEHLLFLFNQIQSSSKKRARLVCLAYAFCIKRFVLK